jgi:hypothetical protein
MSFGEGFPSSNLLISIVLELESYEKEISYSYKRIA